MTRPLESSSVGRGGPDMSPHTEAKMGSTFYEMLENRWSQGKFVCVGLDSEYVKIPEDIRARADSAGIAQFEFNKAIIDATHDLVGAYKPNAAFYEAQAANGGIEALRMTIHYIKEHYPDIPVILDAKRADIGNTNNGYSQFAFDDLKADAITVHPYFGREAMKPFLDRTDKGIIVLARTSNPGAGEFQDLLVGEAQEPLYKVIARDVAENWNGNGNVAIVAGATYPQEIADIRSVIGNMPLLIPGIGSQGGDLEKAVLAGRDSQNQGMIINSSSGIVFAKPEAEETFAQAARREAQKLNDAINHFRVAA